MLREETGQDLSINVTKFSIFFPYSLSRLTAHLFPLHALAGFSVSLSCPKTCTSSCTAGTGAVPGSDVLPHWPEIVTDSDLRQASITVDLNH